MSHKLLTTALTATAAVGGAYLLALRGRTGHPGLQSLQGWSYAHRGLHKQGVPENSMAAFRAALDHGFGIELDIHLMKDGSLGVIHDCSLKRTAGADVNITELTAEDLPNYPLEGTDQIIPLFPQVLELFAGKAPLVIELKADGNNHLELVHTAMKALEGYRGAYCVESFDPRCIRDLKVHYPDVIRGQLAADFAKEKKKFNPAKFALTHNLLNFLTQPDFISYCYGDRNNTPSNAICRKFWGIQGVAWTLRDSQLHKEAVSDGWLPIFEDYIPE